MSNSPPLASQPKPESSHDSSTMTQQSVQHDVRLANASSTGSGSGSAYFTFPVTYAVGGLFRRLGSDTATPKQADRPHRQPRATTTTKLPSSAAGSGPSLAQSLSNSFHWPLSLSTTTPGSSERMPDDGPASSAYMPASRRIQSPFQPPPLTPLSLHGFKASTRDDAKLLCKTIAEEVRLLVPPRLQLVTDWKVIFSLEQDGVSLATLYQKCSEYKSRRGGFVLVLTDTLGGVFGGFLTDAPQPRSHYYGTGECFLWKANTISPQTLSPDAPATTAFPDLDLSSLPPPPSADTVHASRITTLASPSSSSLADSLNHAQSTKRIRFKAFPYSGENEYMIFCETDYLSIGGGDGHYGLCLDDSLEIGLSSTCPTFGNEPLSETGRKFDVLGVEVWYIGA